MFLQSASWQQEAVLFREKRLEIPIFRIAVEKSLHGAKRNHPRVNESGSSGLPLDEGGASQCGGKIAQDALFLLAD